ncbi:hypothetical protein Aple_048930 [Acrocarpospora pleiomorpha]|uniref:Dynamin N-terminal domain-containing protein n=1 Tax=Acrocarpospora pleiomorpha TaxID=90975 RepID=A0A5M3XML6_9ACTN|nr:dynamin family protein [Acrocarpospora pleiomorpha]GES21996.1 hypothetical protein Aple_048930 [Acrocarpospora pleiomorpha]
MNNPAPDAPIGGPNNWAAWEHARKEIERAVEEAKAIAKRVRSGTDFSALDRATKSLDDHTFRIGVVGDFSNGKSTLINAMLASDLLPAGVNPMTSRLAEIRYGVSPRIIIETSAGDRQEITHEEFLERNRKLKSAEDADEPAAPDIDYMKAILESDREILSFGIAYIDVPGHSAGFMSHDAIADDAMRSCDALILVLHADTALRSVESERLRYALLDLEHRSVFVAVNKFGSLRPEQQEELDTGFPRRWERFLGSLDLPAEVIDLLRGRVYFIDSYNTLQDRLGRGESYVGVHAFARLEQDLASLADGNLIEKKLARPRKILLRRLHDLTQTIVDQNKLLDADAADLTAHKHTIDESVDKLRELTASIKQVAYSSILTSLDKPVRDLALDHFQDSQARLAIWAKQKRGTRPPAPGSRAARIMPKATTARIMLISKELTDRLSQEMTRWSENDVFPIIKQRLQTIRGLVLPDLEKFEQELNGTWQELLAGTGATPPNLNIVDPGIDELLDLRWEELPLNLRPVGVVILVLDSIHAQLRKIFSQALTGSSGPPGGWAGEIWREIFEKLTQLALTVLGSDADSREALDKLLENYACLMVWTAVVGNDGQADQLADRYAQQARTILQTRVDALLKYLQDQGERINSLYRNAIQTVHGGLAEVERERIALTDARKRVATLADMLDVAQ